MKLKWTISTRTIAIAWASVVITAVAGMGIQKSLIREQGLTLARQAMRGIMLSAENTRDSVAAMNKGNAFDRPSLLAEVRKTSDLRSTRLYGTIPVVAAWRAIAHVAANEGYEFRIPSRDPRDPKNVLAQQTASATEDIKVRVEGVQSSTAAGITEIEKISDVIHQVSEIVGSIAVAIEEQATVTRQISRNIAEASIGVRDANLRVAESSQATQDIAREIVVVDRAAGQMVEGSGEVRNSASELSTVAEHLLRAMSKFEV